MGREKEALVPKLPGSHEPAEAVVAAASVRSNGLPPVALDPETIPWVPLGPGESFKPLRFLPRDRGRALLLRLEPGTVAARHRHLGEVHATNVSGYRKLLDTGEVVGPGGYVYEPVGNVDSWMAVGDEPVVVHIVAFGAMEYLDEDGEVLRRDSPASLRDLYRRHCAVSGVAPLDLGGEGAEGKGA